MEGKLKYAQTKTQLTVAELKSLCDALKQENRKLNLELKKAQADRKWAMGKLQEAQEDNRRLGLIILRMTEGRGDDGENTR